MNEWLKRERVDFVNPSLAKENERYRRFNSSHFDLFVKFYSLKENEKYCYKYDRGKQVLYSYSEAALRLIFEEIKKDPEGIIGRLRDEIKK